MALLGCIRGQLASLDLPIDVVDMSLGGMLIEIRRAIAVGAVEQFSLELGDGEKVVLSARAVRCSRAGWRRYRIGFEFVDDGATGALPDVGPIVERGRPSP